MPPAWRSTDDDAPREKWKDQSACGNADPELFYGPADQKPMSPEQVAEARSWCDGCPVARDCFIEAIDHEERFGIWGGYTPEERIRAIGLAATFRDLMRHFDTQTLSAQVVKIRNVG